MKKIDSPYNLGLKSKYFLSKVNIFLVDIFIFYFLK